MPSLDFALNTLSGAATGSLSSPDLLQTMLALIVITDLSLLGAERQRLCIRLIAVQGIALGLLPLLAHTGALDLRLMAVTAVFLLVKGVVLPLVLRHTYIQLPPQYPRTPFVGHSVCVLAGMGGFVLSLWFGSTMSMTANPLFSLMFPPAIATVFAGILLIVTRRRVLSQMFGYLVLENGIYLMGVPMAQEDAIWLELSVLLDILVGAFVMGIAIHHINRAFDSTDVDSLAGLKD